MKIVPIPAAKPSDLSIIPIPVAKPSDLSIIPIPLAEQDNEEDYILDIQNTLIFKFDKK